MSASLYVRIIEKIFFNHYEKGSTSFDFKREEIEAAAKSVGATVPKNIGDVVYSFRYRYPFPASILKTCGKGKQWIIRGIGASRYRFIQVPFTDTEPRQGLVQIKIPDSTPEIVSRYALGDEQALLAKVRYNRLIDIFTGVVTYSLQNHLRTQVEGGQIEIDELYVGLSKQGTQYIIPVQAKGGKDRHGRTQLEQDLVFCSKEFPDLVCRPIAAQFLPNDGIALFELAINEDRVEIVDEKHYKLVPASEISATDLRAMNPEKRGKHT